MEQVGNVPAAMYIYRISVKGKLESHWSTWFDDMDIVYQEERGETLLTGVVQDQTALHGLITKIRDLNLELISLERSLLI